ncbi:vacuolar membrane protein [Niveomyces insectorum RCEF 264]|uniref:E3 ubiquitin-protein ligase PEP5 n=1 Tax=Niveomyces insectorum RCEF 264 TaxID=1081102 RepID=A0A167QHC0_9HYPO|nr:vacuolar membrane protein [Niveomyces insectorum RCEF 264]
MKANCPKWKSFDFFEVKQAKPGDDEARNVFESNEIASVCSGSDSLFLGSFDGYVRIVGPSWKIVRSFLAHETGSITHMRQIEGTSLLVTVAEDLSTEPVLKVWALDKPVKKTGLPTCLSTLQINNGKKQFPISAFTTTDDLTQLAVGFANGAVTLIRGDLVNDTGTRQRIIYESEEPITGVQLDVDPKFTTTLFIATTARILKLLILSKGKAQPPKTVEDAGCAVGCMTVDRRTGAIVVARDDAIYYYTLDGRGPPRAYDAPKSLISVYNDYVALVSPPNPLGSSSGGEDNKNGGSNGGGSSGGGGGVALRRRLGASSAAASAAATDVLFNTSTFVLLETDLKVVAHSETLLSPVKAIFQLWGSLCVLTLDGKVRLYRERSLQQRLDMLYQRNLYHLAVELARKAGLSGQQQNTIFRRFGDYLYQKGSYDEAMAQYIKAIDSTEPSQIIRKFLDTQRIHNLIEYLEELHEHHRATADHTTLLLNCYAKLKDIDKLERFIKSPGDLKFDVDTAIAMCRQGGYYEQAVFLAKQHNENDLVVDILIEDAKQYDDALNFIWHLDPETAYICLMKYARVLIEHCPTDATRLFIDYYTGKYKPKLDVPTSAGVAAAAAAGGASGFAYGAASAMQNLAGYITLPYIASSGIATPASTQQSDEPKTGAANAPQQPATAEATEAATNKNSRRPEAQAPLLTYPVPKPKTAFSSFIDHPDEFIVFLEACVKEKDTLAEADRTDLYTTLFEMYLRKASEKKGEQHREEWEAKAKALIDNTTKRTGGAGDYAAAVSAPIEQANVLLLSHLAHFRTGTTLVKEQAGLPFDIFRSYTAAQDTRGALRALHKYGPDAPQLYPAALAYLTSSARVLEEAGPDELAAVLQRIHRDGLLAPLQVVQTLSQNPVATMGMLKPYLQETIERERREIAANQRRIRSFRQETEQRRAELADLGSKPAVFQATRCSQCALPLELPVVHFLCKHSFHQRCLKSSRGGGGEDENDGGRGAGRHHRGGGANNDDDDSVNPATECPLCAQDNATVRAIRRQQEEYATRHDLFRTELSSSEDRFGTVADWFQRGVMGSAGE